MVLLHLWNKAPDDYVWRYLIPVKMGVDMGVEYWAYSDRYSCRVYSGTI